MLKWDCFNLPSGWGHKKPGASVSTLQSEVSDAAAASAKAVSESQFGDLSWLPISDHESLEELTGDSCRPDRNHSRRQCTPSTPTAPTNDCESRVKEFPRRSGVPEAVSISTHMTGGSRQEKEGTGLSGSCLHFPRAPAAGPKCPGVACDQLWAPGVKTIYSYPTSCPRVPPLFPEAEARKMRGQLCQRKYSCMFSEGDP